MPQISARPADDARPAVRPVIEPATHAGAGGSPTHAPARHLGAGPAPRAVTPPGGREVSLDASRGDDPETGTILIADGTITEDTLATLRQAGAQVAIARDGASALLEVGRLEPELLLVRAALPILDGVAVIRAVRARYDRETLPIVLAVGPDEGAQAAAGLEAGANSCVAWPHGVMDILGTAHASRVEDAQRTDEPPAILRAGPITMDVAGHDVRVHQRPIHLPRREFDVLRILLENIGRVVTKETLGELAWGTAETESNTIAVHVRRIRLRIGDTGKPQLIESIRGIGYRVRRE
ncbi:response regulator transcription factor [Frankia sp. CNm7]|uniref:Response regulator transcription factor n=1 Tax=Frankia nepalensis TaxID=1836974 RepID=A0A937RNX3_9ACTN|nr:response regulator transcription factor [Frankia nepalensis]MBL7495916.1 response regulator transcription factor [Frankia nepalensis]MBL7513854.1 response regulator transcription factor [Frankia nepalensis]MBL7518380.1 response regulator transcription factor [Frankia nepalensis]MBL7632254.1 response regulator transcription factor [Frankia nepalensis]